MNPKMITNTPQAARAANLRTLEAETRNLLRGLCRMAPDALQSSPGILEALHALAAGIGDEARQLEEQHSRGTAVFRQVVIRGPEETPEPKRNALPNPPDGAPGGAGRPRFAFSTNPCEAVRT